jgi:predicted peroxiredoxin
MKKIVYVLTHDPRARQDLVSSVFAQALTALSFGYECEMFAMDKGIKLLEAEYIRGIQAATFDPLVELIRNYQDMGGKLYGCNPSVAAHHIETDKCIGGIAGFVNASRLIESSVAANAVFTY